jgi:riboflavin synthase
MFTGIVQAQGKIESVSNGDVVRLVLSKPTDWRFTIGASVAVDGVCLTVVAQTDHTFSADVMSETLARTTLSAYEPNRVVNLERPLKLGDELGGHMVQGHVHAAVQVAGVKTGAAWEITIAVPKEYTPMVQEKRSIAINGVSLTIARVAEDFCTVALIPHTLEVTNLDAVEAGDVVNVEFETATTVAPQ